MDEQTARALNALNRQFYAAVSDDFDATRADAWEGWERFVPILPAADPLRVLDVGCGNGRFGVFLAQRLERKLIYYGVDNSPPLLIKASESLDGLANVTVRLEQRDLVEGEAPNETADVVALFGVLHHIPGLNRRLALMRALAECAAPNGIVAFACWRFAEYDRYRARFSPPLPEWTLEAGDYLLDWQRGTHALRYCHHVDDAELDALIQATGLREINRYRADGRTHDMNLYCILKRED